MSEAAGVIERVRIVAEHASAGLLERETAARLVLLAALAGEHSLLIGPPGTAKSELARRLGRSFTGGRLFERLLTRFSVPEELFGPLSIRGLENDIYQRMVEGYLPSATVAFLDEIFKANSAILNSLLTLLHEREFDNGVERIQTPLVTVVGASNEVPDESELAALYDRFLVRCHVVPVSEQNFAALLDVRDDRVFEVAGRLTTGDLAAIRSQAAGVRIPAVVAHVLGRMRHELDKEGIRVSDRRWVKIANLLRVAAFTEGRDTVELADCGLVVHCAWNRPEQIERVSTICEGALDDVLVEEPRRIGDLATELEGALGNDERATQPKLSPDAKLVFNDERGNEVTDGLVRTQKTNIDGDPLYRLPVDARSERKNELTYSELWDSHFSKKPYGLDEIDRWTSDTRSHVVIERPRSTVREPVRHSADHVAARKAQVESCFDNARLLLHSIEELLGAGETSPAIWPRGTLGENVRKKLRAARESMSPTVAKLSQLRDRVERLPVMP